jgi:hypothetical protein
MSATAYSIALKQGATLSLSLKFTDDNGQVIDLTQATALVMQICDPLGTPVATPAIVPASEMGFATVTADTTAFPLAALPCQISVTAAGVTQISDTFTITVTRGVGS